MNFETYLNSLDIDWKANLSMDQIKRLNVLYKVKTSLEETNRQILIQGLQGNNELDYMTEYRKNNERLSIIYNEIESILIYSDTNKKNKIA